MRLIRFLCVVLLCFPCIQINAQFVDYGNDPARLKWRYVNTPHYKVIYPAGADSMAFRYTQLLETVWNPMEKTIGAPVKARYPVVLHTHSMLANGMVAWAPRRMELISTPSSDLYPQTWDRQLVVHESRHVFQTGRLMKGVVRPFYFLAGEQVSGVAAFAIPKWFFEGDAVSIETAMSRSGRGRLPEYHMPFRTQWLTGNFYSFDKWFMGSYTNYTGNFYTLGYDLTSYARYAYGADIWEKVTDRYVRRIFHLPPFSSALKHYTGVNTSGLFKETFRFMGEEWERQDSLYRPVASQHYLSPVHKRYTSYRYPQVLNDSTLLALKAGYEDINSLVTLCGGKEKRLTYPGSVNSRILLNNGKVYWTEYISGLRWTHGNYSVLKVYDLASGRIRTLTPRQRYLAPAVHAKGHLAALSLFDVTGRNYIVLIDTDSGKEINRFSTPGNGFFKDLVFTDTDDVIGIAIRPEGMALWCLDTGNGTWEEWLSPSSANLTALSWEQGRLWFESGLDGINNIYSLNPEDKMVIRHTGARFGAFTPAMSPLGDKLYFSDYQPEGYRIAEIAADDLLSEKVNMKDPYRFELAEAMARQEQFNLDTVVLPAVSFESKPYRKLSHLFNVHSWAPFYYDVRDAINISTDDFTTIVKPGAMFLSQNHLNTAVTEVGWYYKKGHHHGKVGFNYTGWFPVLDLLVDYGGKAWDMAWMEDEEGNEVIRNRQTGRNLLDLEARVYLPFNLTRNHWVRGIQPALTYYYTNNRYQQHESRSFSNFQYLLGEMRFYNYRRMAQRDILPRWGYQLRLQYLTTPFNKENFGDLYAARLTTYWPGFIRNDGLMLRFGYQYQPLDNKSLYVPKRLLDEPRGYGYNSRTYQQWAFKADYSFTMFSPDVSVGAWAYIKRVRGNLFYDLSRNQANKQSAWTNQSSYGADVIFDWNIFRLNYPISLGARLIIPIDYGNVQVESLFSVSF